ncbi:MAG: LysM peptidoglycan-binding domain-containing protein [Candidatus Sericytochromatia bacterium]
MANVSNNYSALFGATAKAATPAANAAAVPAAVPAALPAPATDTVTLSNQAAATIPGANTAAAAPTAQAAAPATPEQMKQELLKLQAELAAINKQIETLMKALEAQPATPATPAETPPTATPAAGGSHQVQTGDYLWKIAKEKLGDAKRWPEIYELNKDAIGANPNLLYPGQVLKMPGDKTAETTPPTTTTPPATPTPPTTTTPPVTPTPPTTPTPTTPPTTPPATPTTGTDVADVPAVATNRVVSDADVARIAQEFGLAPDKANVTAFLDEMDSYEGANKGKVFGPGMEGIAANDDERNRIKQSVMQIQQAFNLLIKAGKLKPQDAQGKPVGELPLSGTFFKVDAQGKEVKDAQGNPQMDDAFIAAITQFKQDNQIHQNYKLSDGSYAINEYVGPTTVEFLKKALTGLQG